MIEFEGVSHDYRLGGGPLTALRDVDVRLGERRIGVIGANGSGKSTFARMVNGLVVPSGGRVLVDGLDTRTHGRAVRRRVGFCFTDPDAQIIMPTVAEDVAFGLRGRGLARGEVTARVDEVLGTYQLSEYRDHPAHLLSGGQKQLLALAAVLVTEPDIVVMDEPATLLDLANTERVRRVVEDLAQQVLLVTHHLDLVASYDRVLVFDRARLVFDGPPTAAVACYRELVL